MKTKRECKTCNKDFKPMTDKQWEFVNFIHVTLSERHKAYLQ